jgi:plastocyanin
MAGELGHQTDNSDWNDAVPHIPRWQRKEERESDMRRTLTSLVLLCTAIAFATASQTETWHAIAGAQSSDKGWQALAFLPNEMWIHAGDSITWTFPTLEPHSVTFLMPGQVRPPFTVGCPGDTPDGSLFDNSACVNSGRITTVGTTYTVRFPSPGNYRLVCIIHVNMTGLVHVLDPSAPLPHEQDFYDAQAVAQKRALLSVRDDVRDAPDHDGRANAHLHHPMVITGAGEIVSTPGGIQSVSVMRFMQPRITIHVGDTVEWDSSDVSGHTITFGQEPDNPTTPQTPPSANVFADPDGARHAIINSTDDNVHSGFIAQAAHERNGVAQAPAPIAQVLPPVGVTRFRVTFTRAGRYPYICAFHDELGMKGEVIVLP